MRAIPIGLIALLALGAPASAKTTRFWNLTANTITSFALAPAGTDTFGPDLAKADPDGSVDHDERMKVQGVPSGSYDARLIDAKGRTCLVKGVAVKDGEVFSIDEKQLTDCKK